MKLFLIAWVKLLALWLFLTAKADRSDFRKGMEMGADDYITKPFAPQTLAQMLQYWVELKNQ